MKDHVVDWDLDVDSALASVREKMAKTARSLDFNYELRHPGHGDQSVHNPHKGGGAPAGGGMVPKGYVRPKPTTDEGVKWSGERIKTDEEFVHTAHAQGLTPQLKPDTLKPSEVVSDSELAAIEVYRESSTEIQDWAVSRNPRLDSAADGELLLGVVERNSLENDTVLYRGIGGVGMTDRQQSMEFALETAGVGGVVQSSKFVSTSAFSRTGNGFGEHDMVISAPAGTKGAYIGRISDITTGAAAGTSEIASEYAFPGFGEAEFLMPPKIKFRLDKIVPADAGGRKQYHVTIVP